MRTITFLLQARPPFRLDLTVWVLRRRQDNLVDRWDGTTYRRVMLLDNQPVEVAVIQTACPDWPQLQVTVTGAQLGDATQQTVTEALVSLLGLQIDLAAFYTLAGGDG